MRAHERLGALLSALVGLMGCGAGEGSDDGVFTSKETLAAIPGSDARVVAHGIPSAMHPGERRLVWATMQNTGASSPLNDWDSSHRLVAGNINFAWPHTFVTETVPVGDEHTFLLAITAPPTSQTFVARMYSTGFFGETLSVPIDVDTSVTPEWGCTLVSSTLPAELTPDESYQATVTVRNTGSQIWRPEDMKLATRDDPPNLWGVTNADLTATVAPGGTATFGFNLRAPMTPGTYTFARDMKNYAGVGDFRRWSFCVSHDIVVAGTPKRNATVEGASFPSVMFVNESRTLTVTLMNSGNETWTADGAFVLYSTSSPVNLWGQTLAKLTTETPPGSLATFDISLKAPASPGEYRTMWRMRKLIGQGAGFFGQVVDVPVTVLDAASDFGATVSTHTIPPLMTSGTTAPVAIVMRNTGRVTWTDSNVALRATHLPADRWGAVEARLLPGVTVPPNADGTFFIDVTAPPAAATPQLMSWRLVDLATSQFFGETASRYVLVVSPGQVGVPLPCPVPADFPLGRYQLIYESEEAHGNWSDAGVEAFCRPDQGGATLTLTPGTAGGYVASLRHFRDLRPVPVEANDTGSTLYFNGSTIYETNDPEGDSGTVTLSFGIDKQTGVVTDLKYRDYLWDDRPGGADEREEQLSAGGWVSCAEDPLGLLPTAVHLPVRPPPSSVCFGVPYPPVQCYNAVQTVSQTSCECVNPTHQMLTCEPLQDGRTPPWGTVAVCCPPIFG